MTVEKPEITKARMDNSNGTNFEGSQEPIYGSLFLPRKFKIGVTVPGIITSISWVRYRYLRRERCRRQTVGYNVSRRGGMGRSHRNNETFPRIASPIGYVDKDDIFYAVKAIVCTQRDYGRRDDRKQSRLKYLVHSWASRSSPRSRNNISARSFNRLRRCRSSNLNRTSGGTTKAMGSYGTVSTSKTVA